MAERQWKMKSKMGILDMRDDYTSWAGRMTEAGSIVSWEVAWHKVLGHVRFLQINSLLDD